MVGQCSGWSWATKAGLELAGTSGKTLQALRTAGLRLAVKHLTFVRFDSGIDEGGSGK